MRTVCVMQAAQSPVVQPAEVPEPCGSLRAAQDRALIPPAQQGMPQQPVEIVALGNPVPQHMQEPTLGYPNNLAYPGQEPYTTDEEIQAILDSVLRDFGRPRRPFR